MFLLNCSSQSPGESQTVVKIIVNVYKIMKNKIKSLSKEVKVKPKQK